MVLVDFIWAKSLLMNNHVLIIGGNGFIGTAIAQSYRNLGWKVSTMGRRSESDYSIDNIQNIQFSTPVNRVVHLLAVYGPELEADLSTGYFLNVTFTRLCIEFCRRHQIRDVVYISTFQVYGRHSGCLHENSTVSPRNDYALTHYLSERIVSDLSDAAGINYLIIRPTNIYGIVENFKRLKNRQSIPFDFVRRAARGQEIIINHPAIQCNFVGIEDVVRVSQLPCTNQVLNVFGDDTMTIAQFAQKVVQTLPHSLSQIRTATHGHQLQEPQLRIQTLSTCFQPRSQLVEFIQKFAEMVTQDE